ncbi:hypothetical protein C1646_760126 [Rhizophagus diaphanus]|nr:hypothetical protein C1646_760126 [Rhizophagus diaphanus] [Rhizophagus sp. MUCL 43196]
MSQNRKNKNTEKGLASDNQNKMITNINKTVVATEIAHLREDNEFLAGVNTEFSSENDDLKEEAELYSLYTFILIVPNLKIEMKIILKTIKPNDNLDDNETFNSPKNVKIRKIDSKSSFDEDEDYGEEMEEVLIDSQKNAAGDDLTE